ncbi:efflux RND transporter periplasmic adaptor subunit [Nostoc sp. T09]|uniref:efflux RND transporter periplasmic adaptor subunit n=1 Tax=Nostoc sp. T09 TaxID=1932621 RepID=UPI00211B602E|nr:efflux RND transporter periplasmic adaptor subunit [Nostoc sp. T09]
MRYLSLKLKTRPSLDAQKPMLQGLLPFMPKQLSRGIVLFSLIALCSCTATEAQSNNQKGKNQQRAVPVVVATVTRKTIPMELRQTGTVMAYSTVGIKSQVAGPLTGVYFQEGQNVKKGQLLFKIDSRPQQAALMQAQANRDKAIAQVKQAQANLSKAVAQVNQAKANLLKDQTQAKNAQAQAQRYSTLFTQGAISKEQAEQFRTASDAQKATVLADNEGIANTIAAVDAAKADLNNAKAEVSAAEAAVDSAKIALSYNSIFSPITGRTGSLKVNQGNLVKDNDTNPLVTISQISPIYVTSSLPQRLLPELNKYRAQGKIEVDAYIPKDEQRPERGELFFVDSGVDPTTGTIQLKSSFANADGRLSPGQFVNVVVRLTQEPNAIVVPTPAIQTGQQGQFVYVLNPADQTVDMRSVVVGNAVGNESVIQQGLKEGEQVVTDGQFNLRPKAKVQIKQAVGSGQRLGGVNQGNQNHSL